MAMIKVGSKVMWSGAWNTQPEQEVKVMSISRCSEQHSKDVVEDVDECDFEDRDWYIFDLNNGHWCYGNQIHSILDEEPEKEYRISFRAEVYVKGKDLKSVREQFEDMSIFSADALEDYGAEFIELDGVERVDDESYEEVTTEFKRS